jgi:hypothetical protein
MGARSPPKIFLFHQVTTLFEQARHSLGGNIGGEKRKSEHTLIYISNRLAPELEWFKHQASLAPFRTSDGGELVAIE